MRSEGVFYNKVFTLGIGLVMSVGGRAGGRPANSNATG